MRELILNAVAWLSIDLWSWTLTRMCRLGWHDWIVRPSNDSELWCWDCGTTRPRD